MTRTKSHTAGVPAATGRAGTGATLLPADMLRLGLVGLRAKPVRTALSALGVAIGVAAMVAVLGISASSQAKLQAALAELGTNLFTIEANQSSSGETITLPERANGRLDRLDGVQGSAALTNLPEISVYRSLHIDPSHNGGISVAVATAELPEVVAAQLAQGNWLSEASSAQPSTVLGSVAAERLGVTSPNVNVWLGDMNVRVIGILKPVALAPELDSSALIGRGFASTQLEFAGQPSRLYLRINKAQIDQVRALAPAAIRPDQPGTIAMSRPSDALAAAAAADEVFTSMMLGLGSISLLVGAIGIANTMIISVIERRREIGLRRALGATRSHVRLQFVCEALVLSGLGGAAGITIGVLVTAGVAAFNGWTPTVPGNVLLFAALATLGVGAIAGLYPAVRASRTPPTAALNG